MELPLKTVERILKNAGAARVSKDATQTFAEFLENLAFNICKDAKELAELSGKKTVRASDVLMAKKRMKE